MPLFYFILKAGRKSSPDQEGQEFPNEAAARLHAAVVAKELMRNREATTRLWRIQVCNDYLEPSFEVLFAEVDETIAHLPPPLRVSIEKVARTAGALNDAVVEIQRTMSDVRQTLSRADRILSFVPEERPN
jgi:actin-like ATPase involved in cell morphogenesis